MTRARLPIRISGEGITRKCYSTTLGGSNSEGTRIGELDKRPKRYLKGDLVDLSMESARSCGKIARDYGVSEEELLVYCPNQKTDGDDREFNARSVIPETQQADVLHHNHTSLEGGHQVVGRNYHRIRRYCHWRGRFRSVQRYM